MENEALLSHDQAHCTIDTGVIAEARGLDGRLAAGAEGILLEVLDQRVKEDIPCAGHAAAHEEHFGVGGRSDVGQRHAEGVGHLFHLAGRQSIAAAGRIKDILGLELFAAQNAVYLRVLFQQLLHAADNAGGAGILLQTAAPSRAD